MTYKKDDFLDDKFFNSRQPYYNDESDYQTNAPSYYDDLARFRKLMRYLAEKVGHYDKELADRFKQWDELISKFPENVEKLLREWLQDGTMTGLIDELLIGLNAFIERYEQESLIRDKLIARKPDLDGYYTEHKITTYRDDISNTTYWIAHIPKYDKEGNQIEIKAGLSPKQYLDPPQTVREFANREGSTLAINGSTFSNTTLRLHGLFMVDGEVIADGVSDPAKYTLAISKDGKMRSYIPNTTAERIKIDGYETALTGFMPLIENGKAVEQSILDLNTSITQNPHPRTAIGQNANGDTFFFVSTGRLMGEYGMTAKDMIRVMLQHGFTFAFMLDGGGSSSMVEYGSVVNRLSGSVLTENGGTERPVGNVLYIKKGEPSQESKKLMEIIGESAFRSHRFTMMLEGMRFLPSSWYAMEKYLVNGWKNFSSTGSNACRFHIHTNNQITMMGTIAGGQDGTVFMQLPPEIKPMFTTHHMAIGNTSGEMYKIVVGTDGTMTVYNWNPNIVKDTIEYVKLDDIAFAISPPVQGKPHPPFKPLKE